MYRETAEAGQAWKGYTQKPGSGVSKLGHCPHAPGVLHADLCPGSTSLSFPGPWASRVNSALGYRWSILWPCKHMAFKLRP